MFLHSKEGLSPLNESLSRRAFLKAFALGGVTLAFSALDPIPTNTQAANNLSEHQPQMVSSKEESTRDYLKRELLSLPSVPFSRTIVDTLAFNIARFGVLVPVLDKLGIPYGSPSADPAQLPFWDEDHPVRSKILKTVLGSSVIPAGEEFGFRLGPSANFADFSSSTRWDVGIPSSIVFALMHNLIKDNETKGFKFTKESIPITQFFGGLFYWKIFRERGYWHSVVAHGVSNLSLVVCEEAQTLFKNTTGKFRK